MDNQKLNFNNDYELSRATNHYMNKVEEVTCNIDELLWNIDEVIDTYEEWSKKAESIGREFAPEFSHWAEELEELKNYLNERFEFRKSDLTD